MRRWGVLFAMASVLFGALGSLTVPARAASTLTVYRDGYGVPHIEATDLQGVAYGTGYMMATDRLLEMDVIRRLGEGRLSEIFGDLELSADKFTRREFVNLANIQQQYEALDPTTKSMYAAYAKGVNDAAAVVFNDPAKRPALYTAAGVTSFDPWKPTDSVAVDMAFTEVTFGGEGAAGELANAAELQNLQARYGAQLGMQKFNDLYPASFDNAPTVIPAGDGPADPGGGAGKPYAVTSPNPQQQALLNLPGLSAAAAARANYVAGIKALLEGTGIPLPHIGSFAAAVSGARSKSGGAMLLGSPQSGMLSPPIFYEIGWHVPGVTDCEGFTVPGLGPGIGVGWCNNHAWTLVAGNMGDQADLYVERLNPQDPHQYWFNGAWRAMTPIQTTYHVQSALPLCPVPPAPFGPCTPHDVVETNYYTVHGFVFQSDTRNNVGFAYRRAQAGVFLRSLVGTLAWNLSKSYDAFQKGSDEFTASYNLLYADDQGHIAYRFTGLQPVRPGTDRRFPMPGTGEAEWQGYLTQCQMPHDTDPAVGYFAINQGIESKSINWWPNSSDIGVGVVSRPAHDQQLLAGLHGAGLGDLAGLDRAYLEGDDPYAATWYPLFAHALQTTPASDPMHVQLASALGYLDQWRTGGFKRGDGNNDNLEDHVGLSIFEMDNFESGTWPTPLGNQLVAQLEQQEFGNTTDHLHNTQLANESVLYNVLTGHAGVTHVSDPDAFIRAAIKVVLQNLAGSGTGNFNSPDMSTWHRPYVYQSFTSIGLGTFTSAIPGFPASPVPPPIKGWDHGSYSQVIDLGTATGENVEPQGNVARDSTPDQAIESASIASHGAVPPPPNWMDQHDLYQSYMFKPMLQQRAQYAASPAEVIHLDDGGAYGSDTTVAAPAGDSCRLAASTVRQTTGATTPATAAAMPRPLVLLLAALAFSLGVGVVLVIGTWSRRGAGSRLP